jgi:hypothetical protein
MQGRRGTAIPTTPAASIADTSSRDSTSRRTILRQQAASFHPKLITTQIIAIQCLHYSLLALLFQINYLLYGKSVTIDRIFTDEYLRLWHRTGWLDVCAELFAAVAGYVIFVSVFTYNGTFY